MGIFYSYYYGQQSQSAEVTDLQEQPKEGPPDCLSAYITVDTQKDQSQSSLGLPSFPHDHIDDVDKRSIYVYSAGKTEEFFVFPAEKIFVLLQQACNWSRKKTEKMNLIFEGEKLDVRKAVSEYPGLRRGSKVNLIRAS